MKVSVLLCTFRMGGLDISFNGLSKQTFPKNEWELILTDVHYEQRKDAVKSYLKEKRYDIPIYHNKPIRSTYPIDSGSMHRNSAIACAEGEIAIFLCDYAYVQPDWIKRHWDMYVGSGKKSTAMAPHRYWMHPEIKESWQNEPISIFKQEFSPSIFSHLQLTPPGTQDPKLLLPYGTIQYPYFHMKNEGMKMDTLLSINGCDEGYDVDGGHCYSDTDLGFRLAAAGNSFIHDVGNVAEIIQIRDFYPFCTRNRTPEQDLEYFKIREQEIYAGSLQANDYSLAELHRETLKRKKK